jgi:hypothetical protein
LEKLRGKLPLLAAFLVLYFLLMLVSASRIDLQQPEYSHANWRWAWAVNWINPTFFIAAITAVVLMIPTVMTHFYIFETKKLGDWLVLPLIIPFSFGFCYLPSRVLADAWDLEAVPAFLCIVAASVVSALLMKFDGLTTDNKK